MNFSQWLNLFSENIRQYLLQIEKIQKKPEQRISNTNYKLFICQDENEPEDESFVRSGQSLWRTKQVFIFLLHIGKVFMSSFFLQLPAPWSKCSNVAGLFDAST